MNKWLKYFILSLGVFWGLISGAVMYFQETLHGMFYAKETLHFSPENFNLFLPATIPLYVMESVFGYNSSLVALPFAILFGFVIGKLILVLVRALKKLLIS